MAGMFIPPGGFQGFAQQTPAVQAMVGRKKARKKRRKKRATRKRATPSSLPGRTRRAPANRRRAARPGTRKKPARLVKGSAAAKRHMAKLRRMRK